MTAIPASQHSRLRVRIFVDFWNFSLSIRSRDEKFRVDWRKLGPTLASEAGKLVEPAGMAHYEAMHVYGSYDPNKPKDGQFRHWFANTLDRMPGVNVVLLERKKKRSYPKCPRCQTEVTGCKSCGGDMRGTEEKGVDTRIATDIISLAWSESYDVAVLVSADRDFVPVAEFLQSKGIKVVHGAFPPNSSELSQKCWGNLEIPRLMPLFERG
jgi:uncharacterized LabA/DUF88 family protein